MRIISQNSEHDVPYEKCTLWVKYPENIIYATPIGEADTLLQMAKYSTQEKAEKAMLLLHKIYVKAPLENDAKEMGEFVYGTFKAVGNSGYVEPESNAFVFCFPREDEL